MQISQARPPYVQFEKRAQVDRNASEIAGHIVHKDVDFAMITPAGSKDCVEKIAVEWLDQINRQAMDGSYPPEWSNHYRKLFEEWTSGNVMPEQGTSLKNWPVLTPAEIAQFIQGGVRTIEELYDLPDSALQMGWRALRDKARAWLDGAKDKGILAEKMANLEGSLRLKDEQIERMSAKMSELEAALQSRTSQYLDSDALSIFPEKRGPGRPRKEHNA